ncbi:MAG TPA: DUF1801 domain-containing protein, partial [Segetibacter sp.]
MASIDPRIDDYILKAAEFSKPILNHLRAVIHTACPEVKESWKWSFPHFEYAGGILCSMAAFKNHCAFAFWLGSKMKDPEKLLAAVGERTSMGHFGQIKNLSDLPPDDVLHAYIREAMQLNEKGVKISKPAKLPTSKELEIPSDLLDALKQNAVALSVFANFSPSNK